MKILFGIPDITHRELADLEISGIKALIPDCQTVQYGPLHLKRGLVNKILITVKNAFIIKKILNNNKYDLLFLNTTFDFNAVIRDSLTCIILKPCNINIFLKLHGSDPSLLDFSNFYKRVIANWLLKWVKGIGVLSSEEKRGFVQRGIPDSKIFIVKNPVNPSLYVKDDNFKINMALDSNTFVFLYCGRFIPFKGVMDVLKAFCIIRSSFQNTHLICIGDGPQYKMARQFVEKHNLNSFVTFTGFITEAETRPYYSNSDSLVHPSKREGFPMAVFQALAAGSSIITARITAAADYLIEPDNVLWVNHNDPEKLAESMITLLTDVSLVDKMKSNNLLKASNFTADKNALEYLDIFKKLVR